MKMHSSSEIGETSAVDQIATELPFVLSSGLEHFRASGVRTVLDAKDLTSAPAAARELFARISGTSEAPFLVGALPFRHDGKPHLIQPLEVSRESGPYRWSGNEPRIALPDPGHSRISSDPSPEAYEQMVARTIGLMESHPELHKVVLGRRLIVESTAPLRPQSILTRLAADPNITTFAVPLPSLDGQPRLLVGATPELLLQKSAQRVLSIPLAGSARRLPDPIEDQHAANDLLRSDKDRREHALVVESVVERLAPFCRDLRWSNEPALYQTATMWHLGTRIEGDVRDASVSTLDLVVAVHPTAAVCGSPRDTSEQVIAELEPFDRGFFTGAVGWCNAAGDGCWLVTIRCAEIAGNRATLFAGAGIVPESDPRAEVVETAAKFQAILSALALDEADTTSPGGSL